ncbi:MAG TPA: zinc ribbon domain-containing protein, partial [Candidatus Limnocylindrales bacterium]|nr:zinc ribbon domain-containing protein [Candidatus Limnocylindrales bacterium]
GIFEILELDDPIRRLIAAGAAESMVRAAAVESGMRPIGEDGLLKVLEGETSLEELRRVVFYEEEAARLCPSCRQTAAAEYHFCPHCGHTIAAACLKCDRRVDASWAYCPGCGTRREPSSPPESAESLIAASESKRTPLRPRR